MAKAKQWNPQVALELENLENCMKMLVRCQITGAEADAANKVLIYVAEKIKEIKPLQPVPQDAAQQPK